MGIWDGFGFVRWRLVCFCLGFFGSALFGIVFFLVGSQ